MSALPERYQRYAQPLGQQPVQPCEIELYGEADPVVLVPDPYDPNRSVAVRRSMLQPMVRPEPRDLAPQPLLDPVAQRLLGGGVGSGVALWGGGHFLAGAGQFVSGLTGMGALLFFLAIVGARAALMGGRGGTYIHNEQHTHVDKRWSIGRTDISNQQ
jgi:hypothetical protein